MALEDARQDVSLVAGGDDVAQPSQAAHRSDDATGGEDATGSEVAAPHLQEMQGRGRPKYICVIPSYNRPTACKEKSFSLLLEQGVPLSRVFVFVAAGSVAGDAEDERTRYSKILVPLGLPEDNVIEGVKGIMEQRNFIVRWVLQEYGEMTHVVSMDDDLEGLFYKVRTGFHSKSGGELGKLQRLEPGGLEAWIAHAANAMSRTGSYIWSLNTSENAYYMRTDVIGTSLGMCNGYLYGFLARPDDELFNRFKDATEDRERSVRYFAKDGICLRYKMYTAKTKCFVNVGGLQTFYETSDDRKEQERQGHQLIQDNFPGLYKAQKSKGTAKLLKTMEGEFTRRRCLNPDFVRGLDVYGEPITLTARPRAKKAEAAQQTLLEMAAQSVSSSSSFSFAQSSSSSSAPLERMPSAQDAVEEVGEGEHVGEGEPAASKKVERLPSIELLEVSAPDGTAAVELDVDADPDHWACARCTLRNSTRALACAACSTTRPAADAWQCLRCETYNPQGFRSCVGCALARASNQQGGFTVYVDSDSETEEGEAAPACEEQLKRVPRPHRGESGLSLPQEANAPVQSTQPGPAAKRQRLLAFQEVAIVEQAEEQEGWTCRSCTLINQKEHGLICEACFSPRHTWEEIEDSL